jgi:hypothetical protein
LRKALKSGRIEGNIELAGGRQMGKPLTVGVILGSVLAFSVGAGCALHGSRHRLDGTILGLSPDASTLEVTGRDGQKVSVVLSGKTEYRRGDSHKASVTDVKAGSNVIVVYDVKDGVNRAVEVHVLSAAR